MFSYVYVYMCVGSVKEFRSLLQPLLRNIETQIQFNIIFLCHSKLPTSSNTFCWIRWDWSITVMSLNPYRIVTCLYLQWLVNPEIKLYTDKMAAQVLIKQLYLIIRSFTSVLLHFYIFIVNFYNITKNSSSILRFT